MRGLPDVHMAGTLTADPELRFTPSGSAVANFTLAANERKYDPEANRYTDAGATFLRCAVWNTQAENLAESLVKGQRVMVHGSLRQRSFETREGDKRTVLELDVHEVAASLLYGVASVTKAARGQSGGTPSTDRAQAGQSAGGEDPWASAPVASTSDTQGVQGAMDEPPF